MNALRYNGYKNIYAVEKFEKEFKEIFGKNKKELEKRLEKLWFNLNLLDNLPRKEDLPLLGKDFELVVNTSFFAIRDKSKPFNPRVIYAYIDEHDEVVLLHAFSEKNTKADYRRAAEIAQSRLRELEELK